MERGGWRRVGGEGIVRERFFRRRERPVRRGREGEVVWGRRRVRGGRGS